MGMVFFNVLPEFLNGVVIRRIGRQVKNRQSVSMLGEECFGSSSSVITGAILNENNMLARLAQNFLQEFGIGNGIKARLRAFVKESSAKIIDQTKDFVSFTLARG